MQNLVKNLRDKKQKHFERSCKKTTSAAKPGTLLRVNAALDFLWRSPKTKDHFELYVPLLEKSVVLVLKTRVLCGDFRFSHNIKIERSIKEYPEYYKDLHFYNIITPLTPCVEVLYDNDVLYLECALFPELLKKNYLEVISK